MAPFFSWVHHAQVERAAGHLGVWVSGINGGECSVCKVKSYVANDIGPTVQYPACYEVEPDLANTALLKRLTNLDDSTSLHKRGS